MASTQNSVETTFGHFFKPEVRKQGADFLAKGSAVLSQGSDTQVEGYVKGSSLAKVSFRSSSIESSNFTVDCTCTASKKGQLCKHIWALLLMTEKNSPDFLESKNDLEKASATSNSKLNAEPAKVAAKVSAPITGGMSASSANKVDYKAKQADYRKQQYQAQKQRAKDAKGSKKQSKQNIFAASANLSPDVEEALQFFSENGFPMEYPVDTDALSNAKRILSRIFHPDKGGTHEEIVLLLKHVETLED